MSKHGQIRKEHKDQLGAYGEPMEECLEVILDSDGEHIGPTNKIVIDFSYFPKHNSKEFKFLSISLHQF